MLIGLPFAGQEIQFNDIDKSSTREKKLIYLKRKFKRLWMFFLMKLRRCNSFCPQMNTDFFSEFNKTACEMQQNAIHFIKYWGQKVSLFGLLLLNNGLHFIENIIWFYWLNIQVMAIRYFKYKRNIYFNGEVKEKFIPSSKYFAN